MFNFNRECVYIVNDLDPDKWNMSIVVCPSQVIRYDP